MHKFLIRVLGAYAILYPLGCAAVGSDIDIKDVLMWLPILPVWLWIEVLGLSRGSQKQAGALCGQDDHPYELQAHAGEGNHIVEDAEYDECIKHRDSWNGIR